MARGLGLAEIMSISGPSSMMLSRRDVRRGSSFGFVAFLGLAPVSQGGVPAVWQHNGYDTPSVSLTSFGARVTEMRTCRIA